MPVEYRRVKNFGVYVQMNYTVESGGEENFFYYGGDIMDSMPGAPYSNKMVGTGSEHWKLVAEIDSIVDAIREVKKQVALGHTFQRIKLEQRVQLDENFEIVV
jgi:hypothetical protein